MIEYQVGERVRPSGYVLQSKRDYWLSCGREPMKSGAKNDLDKHTKRRGTITKILHNGLEVTWDDGGVSSCLSYVVEKA